MSIYTKYVEEGEFEFDDALDYVKKRTDRDNFSEDDRKHLARGIKDISDWYVGKKSLGDFLQSVVSNDLIGALSRADLVNRKGLGVITQFLYNNVPTDYKQKAKRDFNKTDQIS